MGFDEALAPLSVTLGEVKVAHPTVQPPLLLRFGLRCLNQLAVSFDLTVQAITPPALGKKHLLWVDDVLAEGVRKVSENLLDMLLPFCFQFLWNADTRRLRCPVNLAQWRHSEGAPIKR